MKRIRLKIKGTSPLLMHRYPLEEDNGKAKKKGQEYDPKEDAEKALYKDEKGAYVPGVMLKACFREAGKNFKNGKSSYKDTVLSSVFVEEQKIYLKDKKTYDEIDRRAVVVQRNRVVRSRPKFNNWEIETTLRYNDDRITEDKIRQIVEEAGITKGLGDYRPAKGGEFGTFEIDTFEVLN